MDYKEQSVSNELQGQPQQGSTASDQSQTTTDTPQWQSKAAYEVHTGPSEYDNLQFSKMKTRGHFVDVFIGLAVCAVLFLSFIPDLPSYTTPGSYRNMPATPIIGVAYLALESLIIYRMVLTRRKNILKKNKESAGNPAVVPEKKQRGLGGRIAVGVALFCLAFVTPAGWLALFLVIGPVYCNFTSCAAS